jgi:regulator of cell morphogenesis and NO signaling
MNGRSGSGNEKMQPFGWAWHWYSVRGFLGEKMADKTVSLGEHTVREVALAWPVSVAVFAQVGIEFSCGGDLVVSDACQQVGITVEGLWSLIQQAAQHPAPSDLEFWHNASPSALLDHLIHRYHEPLRKELSRLESLSQKVEQRHGEAFPQVVAIRHLCASLRRELELHMAKEERVLFPLIRRLDAQLQRGMTDRATAKQLLAPLRLAFTDHDALINIVRELHEQSGGYGVPTGVSASYHMLCSGLRSLQFELQLHFHLENNVLFGAARDMLVASGL